MSLSDWFLHALSQGGTSLMSHGPTYGDGKIRYSNDVGFLFPWRTTTATALKTKAFQGIQTVTASSIPCCSLVQMLYAVAGHKLAFTKAEFTQQSKHEADFQFLTGQQEARDGPPVELKKKRQCAAPSRTGSPQSLQNTMAAASAGASSDPFLSQCRPPPLWRVLPELSSPEGLKCGGWKIFEAIVLGIFLSI